MKSRIAVIVVVLVVGALGLGVMLQSESNPTSPTPHIAMRSDPYPLVIGSTTLSIIVTGKDGSPVPNAAVSLSAEMMHEGMLPLYARPLGYQNGSYPFAVTWPMTGVWMIDVTAQLPGQTEVLRDQFEVYIYAVPVDVPNMPVQFHSAADNRAFISDPATEYGVIIPQGTKVLMMYGQSPDVIPSEIRLHLSGQHTLVIQNNDLADHTIGPFTVRAGEVIRQTFTRPSVYQGTCSLNVAAELNIIVEE